MRSHNYKIAFELTINHATPGLVTSAVGIILESVDGIIEQADGDNIRVIEATRTTGIENVTGEFKRSRF